MSDSEPAPTGHRHRKSVAFAEDETLIDGNGEITRATTNGNDDKTTAESHSQPSNGTTEIDDASAAFDELALAKKKKKSKKKEADKEKDEDAGEAPAADGELDLAALKKKKKKSKTSKTEDAADDFDAKLAKAEGGDQDAVVDDAADDAVPEDAGDMDEGTGIWAHDSIQPVHYNLLLSRFFKLLDEHNPGLGSGSKSYKIPPPQCLREGNKKTIFANIPEICRRMKRSEEHVAQFLFAELGTTGSVDGSRRLVIKGKYLQKQIENVLRRYIVEYVSCKTCKSPDTELVRGENRLYFIECNSCASRRSVQSIKTGFSAQIGKRRRQRV